LRDQATRLIDYVKTPQEEAQALRGLLFAQYLGGSVASAMVNALQPLQITFPYLSQYGGAVQAGKQMIAATRDALRNVTGEQGARRGEGDAREGDGRPSRQVPHQALGPWRTESTFSSSSRSSTYLLGYRRSRDRFTTSRTVRS